MNDPLVCPECGAGRARVYENVTVGQGRIRRRQCRDCSTTWMTTEMTRVDHQELLERIIELEDTISDLKESEVRQRHLKDVRIALAALKEIVPMGPGVPVPQRTIKHARIAADLLLHRNGRN